MNIVESTTLYERWLAQQTQVISADLKRKHQFMAEGPFPFLRATFYRWLQLFPKVCKHLRDAPPVLAVGDLHVENFGTWRDLEGRLTWGINDFDEAAHYPYVQDLVRLAASAIIAIEEGQLALKPRLACQLIIDAYLESLKIGGAPFVLDGKHRGLRDLAIQQMKEPQLFWDRLLGWPTVTKSKVPKDALVALERAMPRPLPPYRVVARQSGLGSRGRQRFVAIYPLHGGLIAREAKARVPPAAAWRDPRHSVKNFYSEILHKAVRNPDWTFKLDGCWWVRRLAADCTKIRLADFPAKRNEERILFAMGWETANIHLGSAKTVPAIVADLKKRKSNWLYDASGEMSDAVRKDWKSWQDSFES